MGDNRGRPLGDDDPAAVGILTALQLFWPLSFMAGAFLRQPDQIIS